MKDLKHWVYGMDLTRCSADKRFDEFGWMISAGDATVYEEPFRLVEEQVHPMRRRTPIVIARDDDTTVRGRMNSRSPA